MKILVLSPHRDDAAFSVGLGIENWLEAGHTVTILTIFTRSTYAPLLPDVWQTEADRFEAVSSRRRMEDTTFLACLPGLTMTDMQLEDAPIRLRCDIDHVCEMPVADTDPALPLISAAISRLVADSEISCALVLPLALGHHVDHRVVRNAALRCTRQLPCAFYEDLPYATRESAATDLERFRKDFRNLVGDELIPVTCSHTKAFERKLSFAKLYPSQVDDAMAHTIAGFSLRYGGAERLWANDAWVSLPDEQGLSLSKRQESEEPLL